ncbi:MAG TPA: ankyrin repeat domain-containing protein, partial [Candidatus Polarisedimenticolia bacterium]|nr:ankyrin repeat domain-containing protein [Candidatus Polarisedimenticolia bacterium]
AALGLSDRVREGLRDDPGLVRGYSHDGWTALHLASFFGHLEVVDLLLEHGADVNARSRSERFARSNTPLHAAAANGRTEVAGRLLAKGADVNAVDGSGFTPLDLAGAGRNDLLIILLLDHGAKAR